MNTYLSFDTINKKLLERLEDSIEHAPMSPNDYCGEVLIEVQGYIDFNSFPQTKKTDDPTQ